MPSLLADLWNFWQAVLYKYNTDGSLICRASLLSRWILFCSERPERFAHDRCLKKSTWAKSNRSNSLFGIKRGNICKKHTKNTICSNFSSKELIFLAISSGCSFVMSNLSESLNCSQSLEWLERFAHGRSFVMSDLSESLTVALLFRATWAIRSQVLFKKEQMSKEQWEQFSNEKNIKKTIFFQVFLEKSLVF